MSESGKFLYVLYVLWMIKTITVESLLERLQQHKRHKWRQTSTTTTTATTTMTTTATTTTTARMIETMTAWVLVSAAHVTTEKGTDNDINKIHNSNPNLKSDIHSSFESDADTHLASATVSASARQCTDLLSAAKTPTVASNDMNSDITRQQWQWLLE